MRPNYDFSGGVRGKYVERYRRGNNVVLLDPEIAAAFPDSAAVNDALRALLAIANLTFALPVSFPAVRRRILNAINAGSGEKAWVKTLPLV